MNTLKDSNVTVRTEFLSPQHFIQGESTPNDVPPPHILRQRWLNQSILGKLSRALGQDLAADLTIILSEASATYASKRSRMSDPRPLIRKNGLSDTVTEPKEHESFPEPPHVIYPLALDTLNALGLLESSSTLEIEDKLACLPQLIEHSETLFKLFGRQITRLNGMVVVKIGKDLDPAEHYLLEYLQKNCPTMRSPIPLGFVTMDQYSYFFMSYVPGVTIHSRWPSMSDIQKREVCSQLNAMLLDLRGLSWIPGTPLGSLTSPHTCKDARKWIRTSTHIYNEAQFNDFLLRAPRKGISSSYLKWLRSCLRDDHRIVLSHGDLNPKNIILLDGEEGTVSISGIVDWEMGGWYPEYWDSLKALNLRGTDDDSDWWCTLPKQISQHVAEVALDRLVESTISGD